MAAGPSADVLGGGLSGRELFELPSRGQDNESKREVWIPIVGAGASPIHPAGLQCAARTHMENGVPKSIVLGGRDDGDAPGSGMLPGVLRSLNIAGVTPILDLNQSIKSSSDMQLIYSLLIDAAVH